MLVTCTYYVLAKSAICRLSINTKTASPKISGSWDMGVLGRWGLKLLSLIGLVVPAVFLENRTVDGVTVLISIYRCYSQEHVKN